MNIRNLLSKIRFLGLVPGLIAGTVNADPVAVSLVEAGEALMTVVISDEASPDVKELAGKLADYLGRISGAEFSVAEGDGASGIAVGTAPGFPAAGLEGKFDPDDFLRREEYILRTHSGGVWIVGATKLAVENAVWDFLYRLGYRQFFPGEIWEVVPEINTLKIALDEFAKPDYLSRTLGISGSRQFGWQREAWRTWQRRNRMRSALHIRANHMYQSVIRRNREVFDENPGYYALVDGERRSRGSKMCISNPDVRKIFIEYALDYFDKNPDKYSISLDPSDGGGWCECEDCAALGSISDQTVVLCNEVAEAVEAEFGKRFIAQSAYNQHAPPPSIMVHPNVVMSVTTHQRKGGGTVEEVLAGWARRGVEFLSVGEAYSTFVWDQFMPGRQRGANIPYLARTLPEWHDIGVRRLGGWTGDAWGPVGLGNYLISRFTWDVGAAENVGDLVEDFLKKAFGEARDPMERFYRLTHVMDEDAPRPLHSEDLVGRMYRTLGEALDAAEDPKVRARVSALVLYTRYVELVRALGQAGDGEKAALYEELARHSYRTQRNTFMVDSKFFFSTIFPRRQNVELPDGVGFGVAADEDPWKDTRPFSEAEIDAMVEGGIARNRLIDFTPVYYSEELVPAVSLDLEDAERGSYAHQGTHGPVVIYTWVDEAPARIPVNVRGGLFRGDRGDVSVELFSPEVVGEGVDHLPVAVAGDIPPDGKEHIVELETTYSGLHRLVISDGGDRTWVGLAHPSMPATFESGVEGGTFAPFTDWSMYFYVPKGTEVIGGYANNRNGHIIDPLGGRAFAFATMEENGYFSVPVPEGQDGKLWRFHRCRRQRILLTVPPYLAPSAADLLLPREVVEADSVGQQ